MLIRPKARILALSLRMPPGALVIKAHHPTGQELVLSQPVEAGGEVWRELRVQERDGSRTLYELVAESDFEKGLLRTRAQLERAQEDSRTRYVWRLGKQASTGTRQPDKD